MFSFLQKLATAYDILPTENYGDDIGTDAFSERGSKATILTVGTVCTSTVIRKEATQSTVGTVCTSTVTGEELTQSSLLETTKSVLVNTNLDVHTDPTFTDPALLITRTITPKVYSNLKKKKKINVVLFKIDQRFWTTDEVKEDADKEDNHDGFSVCTDAACSDACSDVMPSFLDVTKRSLFMSMPLSDFTKPRTDKSKFDKTYQ